MDADLFAQALLHRPQSRVHLQMNGTVLFSANRGYALLSSREALIRHFLTAGWQVVLATADDKESRKLVALGAQLEPIDFNRGGLAIGADVQAYSRFLTVLRTWRPTLIQQFNAKPVILGTLAARRVLKETVQVVNVITGLGHAFITGGFIAHLAGLGYRAALPLAEITVFQNRDDQAMFIERGWVPEPQTELIVGSGVDIERFAFVDREGRCHDTPIVVMIGRLLRQKGISEFAEVASRIRQQWPGARFLLAGEEDPVHPDAVDPEWLRNCQHIEYLGRLADVSPLLTMADLLLFPSYREGVPRVIVEAAATGLPTVAFAVPGVREAVVEGTTGFLVAHCDVDALTVKVSELLEDTQKRLEMGRAARQLTEEFFDIREIQLRYLGLYRLLGVDI